MADKIAHPTQEFDGCDGGDAGSPENPSIWLFGIEHGKSDAQSDQDYTVQTQLQWSYNQKAFKLLAAIQGESVSDYKAFAHGCAPFANKSKGYFKGNLYPHACRNTSTWPAEAQEETGMTKAEYRSWCHEHHLPAINRWVLRYQPKLFIGVGITHRMDFAAVVYGEDHELSLHEFKVNGHLKKIFYADSMGRRLIVVPHLSGSPHGLNSDESLQIAGTWIADFMA